MKGALQFHTLVVLTAVGLLKGTGAQYDVTNCPPVDSTFELVTGWMYSSPSDILETKAGTLQLAECLNACRQNQSCQAVNFETGLCVLFRSQAADRAGEIERDLYLDSLIVANPRNSPFLLSSISGHSSSSPNCHRRMTLSKFPSWKWIIQFPSLRLFPTEHKVIIPTTMDTPFKVKFLKGFFFL